MQITKQYLWCSMEMFYFDEKMCEYERTLDYVSEFEYLEQIYLQNPTPQLLLTLITYAWYYLIEGDINVSPLNYDWRFFQSKFEQYVDLGLTEIERDERICCILGYVLDLHWMHLGQRYENTGKNLLQHCIKNAKDQEIVEIAKFFVDRNSANIQKEKTQKLFPNGSILDKYFEFILDLT